MSLYVLVSFRGVNPIFLSAMWSLKITPRVQFFLRLLSDNKIMSWDNQRKRGMLKPMECEHCKEIDAVFHLFFECILVQQLWAKVEKCFQQHRSTDACILIFLWFLKKNCLGVCGTGSTSCIVF